MNAKLLLIAVAVVSLSSCSSVYKSGQTPDDVYYSPVRMYDAEEKKDDSRIDESRNYSYSELSQIRLGINNPRWRYLDDFSYSPYLYGYNYGYYYNPYYYQWPVYNYGTVVTVNPKNSTPRMTNLSAYNTAYNNNNVNTNSKYSNPVTMPVRSYNNNNGSRLSNTLNKIFNSGSNYNNSNNSYNNSNQSTRSYTPSTNSNSSSSGSSSSGSSTSRPVRNGKG